MHTEHTIDSSSYVEGLGPRCLKEPGKALKSRKQSNPSICPFPPLIPSILRAFLYLIIRDHSSLVVYPLTHTYTHTPFSPNRTGQPANQPNSLVSSNSDSTSVSVSSSVRTCNSYQVSSYCQGHNHPTSQAENERALCLLRVSLSRLKESTGTSRCDPPKRASENRRPVLLRQRRRCRRPFFASRASSGRFNWQKMVSTGGGIAIAVVVLAIAAVAGWVVFTQLRARRLGVSNDRKNPSTMICFLPFPLESTRRTV